MEKALFSLKFIGPELQKHGVGIYDLGISLISFQRIINKSYLVLETRLERRTLRFDERKKLALQLKAHKKGSDWYGLIPLLSDPSVIKSFKLISEYVMSGFVSYYVADILSRLRRHEDSKRIFIGNIYAEVVNIIGRIDSPSGIQQIEIASPLIGKKLIFNEDHKTKIKQLSNEFYLGEFTSIQGKIYRLYPNSNIVTIRTTSGEKVNIFLDESNFNYIRYKIIGTPTIEFFGHPRFRFGSESQRISEFEATKIKIYEE